MNPTALDKKKLTAALAAVAAYLQAEQEALAAGPGQRAKGPLSPVRLWAVGGRMSQMQLRQMMQLRTFQR